MALVVNDRVKETSTTTGTGTFDLAGAATGFQSFVAGIGDTNTTFYAIFNQGTTEWEVGLGTVTDAATDTLARTTILESSNSDAAVDFGAGTKDVFCTLPASRVIYGKTGGTDFTGSMIVGHSTTGTLSSAGNNTGVGIDAMDAISSGDHNTVVGYRAGTTISTGERNTAVGQGALATMAGGTDNVAIGRQSLSLSTGTANIGIGRDSGEAIAAGTRNICIGTHAGDNITSGSGNILIGTDGLDADASDSARTLKIVSNDGSSITTHITGDGNDHVEVAVAWNPTLSTTGKAFVMGF